ncbi:MAG TPA: hypothetical protein VEI97_07515 [bacterium]|nr:hypothetical protein [bacterium]
MTSSKGQKAEEKAEAIARLRELLPHGSRVYTVLRHVSSSGMSRRIDLYTIRDNEPVFLTGYVGKALGYRHDRKGGLVVGGCGMDMGFHLVHSLSYAIHGMEKHDAKGDERSGYTLRHDWL